MNFVVVGLSAEDAEGRVDALALWLSLGLELALPEPLPL